MGLKYLSRMSTDPALDEHGNPIVVLSRDLTDYDLRCLRALATRRTLNCDSIAKLIGGVPKSVRDRFNVLKRKPNLYVRVCEEQANNPKQHLKSKLYYELAEAGITALEERGHRIGRRSRMKRLKHQVMIDEILASWQIGFAEFTEFAPIWWPEILTSEKTPLKTREAKHPSLVPVTFEFNGKVIKDLSYECDDKPFGFRRPDGRAMFIMIEADCDSESATSDYYGYATLQRKFAQQIAILEQGLYRSQFGFPNMHFLFYVPTVRRMESAMGVLEEMTKHKPKLRRSFAFTTHPTFTNYDQKAPSAWALTDDYQRVDCPPLNFTGGGEHGRTTIADKNLDRGDRGEGDRA